jgi:hypothetical protein
MSIRQLIHFSSEREAQVSRTVSFQAGSDVDHPPGAVGLIYAKPDTAWKIHPMTAIAER